MDDDRSTINSDGNQDGEALDAELLPEEFPDDRPLVSRDYGTTEAEQAHREPLSRRLRREEPDLGAEDFEVDGDANDDGDSPELLSQLDENGRDVVAELVAERARAERGGDDSGQQRSPRSAEEDAIHVVDAEEEHDDEGEV